jgi:dTDP-glucose pyrophosphorylase
MIEISRHIINKNQKVSEALYQLEALGHDLTLFVSDERNRLVGTLTDGDIRRGLLKKKSLEDGVEVFMNPNFSSLTKGSYDISHVSAIKKKGIDLLPVVDSDGCVVKIVNLLKTKTILPIDAVIMAGGEGRRLRPMTESVPKPLLKVGDKPIIEHNIDRLIQFGVDDYWICVRYLGEQIEQYFNNGASKNINISYVWEDAPLGTIGAVNKIKDLKHDHILVTNSDLLTDLDYEEFYLDFVKNDADLSVVTIPYSVNIPYAVLETSNGHVLSFKEKPTFTYYSNGGIYLLKREMLQHIPKDFFNATDLMELLIQKKRRVTSYPLRGYWLDIGKTEDFNRAQEDIKYLKLK